MLKKLTILLSGLAIAGALVAPAAAQAEVRSPGVAAISTPDLTTPPGGTLAGCDDIKQYQTGKYATDSPDHDWLWFEGYSERTRYCLYDINNNSVYEIEDATTGNCLAVDTSDNNQIEEEGCAAEYSWELWAATDLVAVSGANDAYVWANGIDDEADCLYDYQQEPAVATGCANSDTFEWFWLIPVN
jgi:hypothetical protein